MEPRKVQKVGYSTLSISLPMSWTKKTGIKKGDVVFISEEKDGALRLTMESGSVEDRTTYVVNVDNCDNTKIIDRVIVGNYVLGRNMLRVESSRRLMREQIESIREVTQRLLGIGIIEESDHHLLLQCSVDPKSFPISTVMRRLYVITSIMFKEAVDAIIEGDLELAKDAITREHEADMIYWLMIRLLSSAQQSGMIAEQIGITDPMDILQNNAIAWFLEMIGDRVLQVAVKSLELQKYRNEPYSDLLERLSQMGLMTFTIFDNAAKSIFDSNAKIASDAVDMVEMLEKEEKGLLEEYRKRFSDGNIELVALLSAILWEFKIIAEGSSAIAKTTIDYVLRHKSDICATSTEKDE